MIMQAHVPVRLTRVGLLSLAMVAAATLPGWARAEPSAPAPPQQVVDHGRIQGRVINAEGVGQPGVTITLASEGLVRPMVDVTSVEGRYEFPIVPTGTYDVSFELEGFKKVVRANVIIERGFNAEVNASLGAVQAGLVRRDVEAEASPPPALSGESLDRVTQFEADRQQILDEAQQRVTTLAQQLVAALQSLEAQYTRDGRTDEAAAIRHYLETRPRGGGR